MRLARSHEVHVVCLGLGVRLDPTLTEAESDCASITVVPHDFSRSACALRALLTLTPYDIVIHKSADFRDALGSAINTVRPNCIYFSRYGSAQYVLQRSEIPQVIDQHDLSNAFWEKAAIGAEKLWFRLYSRFNYFLALRSERKLYPRFDAVVSVSEWEMEQTRQFIAPETPIITIPNGADTEYYRPTGEEADPPTIVFTGAMNAQRNVDAAYRFAESILPTVIASHPDARFQIVGHSPSPAILRLAESANVEVTGEVEDVRPYLAGAAVVVAPFWSGSGVKHKVPIAMSMAKALVVTDNACQGLSIRNGREALIANADDELAACVIRLLDDRSLRQSLGASARAFIQQHYAWDSLVEKLAGWLEEVVGEQQHG